MKDFLAASAAFDIVRALQLTEMLPAVFAPALPKAVPVRFSAVLKSYKSQRQQDTTGTAFARAKLTSADGFLISCTLSASVLWQFQTSSL